jgi:hypothetical protein
LQPDRLQIGNVHAGIKTRVNKNVLKLHHNFNSASVTAPSEAPVTDSANNNFAVKFAIA